MDLNEIGLLSNLINKAQADQNNTDQVNPKAAGSSTVLTPASLVPESAIDKAKATKKKGLTFERPGDIWAVEEIKTLREVRGTDINQRKRPEFDFAYAQTVGAEEVFLGIGGVLPAINHCKILVIKIKMPNTKLDDIDLDLTDTTITVSSRLYHLSTALPSNVKSSEGSAKWDSDFFLLKVSVPLDKEIYDI